MSHQHHDAGHDAQERPTAPAVPPSPHAGGVRGARMAGIARSGATLAMLWVLSRGAMLVEWATSSGRTVGDTTHYWMSLRRLGALHALPEYPVWVVWIMAPLRHASGHSMNLFIVLFALLVGLCDLGTTVLLWRRAGRRAAWYWTLFAVAMGPSLLWFRFDIVTGALVTGALVERDRRPVLAGACVALGAAIKLWPVLLVATLWRRGRSGRRFLAGVVGTGVLLFAGAAATSGWNRITSPLRWQAGRGLQIESIAATPLMLARCLADTGRWEVRMTGHLAYEIFGPGVSTMLRVADGLNALLLVAGLVALAQSWRHGHGGPLDRHREQYDMAMSTLALTALFMVANKTFSPQYLFWLAGPLAVLAHLRPRVGGRRSVLLCLAGLVLGVLTQTIFPHHYAALWSVPPGRVMALVLAARNALLIVLAAMACVLAFGRRRPVAALSSHDAGIESRARSGAGPGNERHRTAHAGLDTLDR